MEFEVILESVFLPQYASCLNYIESLIFFKNSLSHYVSPITSLFYVSTQFSFRQCLSAYDEVQPPINLGFFFVLKQCVFSPCSQIVFFFFFITLAFSSESWQLKYTLCLLYYTKLIWYCKPQEFIFMEFSDVLALLYFLLLYIYWIFSNQYVFLQIIYKLNNHFLFLKKNFLFLRKKFKHV